MRQPSGEPRFGLPSDGYSTPSIPYSARSAANTAQEAQEAEPLLYRPPGSQIGGSRRRPGERGGKSLKNDLADVKRWATTKNSAVVAILGPWAALLVTSFLVTFVSYPLGGEMLAVVDLVILVGVFLFALVDSYRNRAFDRVYVSLLCAIGAFVGGVAGIYNYNRYLADYYAFDTHRQYSNVWPDELAAAHRDASAIVFSQGVGPDLRVPMAFNTGYHSYCVAPITLRRAELTTPDIQYWAAGVDCCDRQGFWCDDSNSPKANAHAGLVMFERTYPFQSLFANRIGYYKEAVQMSYAKYGLTSAPRPIFLRWVQDLDAAHRGYWVSAWILWIQVGLIALPASALLGFAAPMFAWLLTSCMSYTSGSRRYPPV